MHTGRKRNYGLSLTKLLLDLLLLYYISCNIPKKYRKKGGEVREAMRRRIT